MAQQLLAGTVLVGREQGRDAVGPGARGALAARGSLQPQHACRAERIADDTTGIVSTIEEGLVALNECLGQCQRFGRIPRHQLEFDLFVPCMEFAAELARLRIVDVPGRPLPRRQFLAKDCRQCLGLADVLRRSCAVQRPPGSSSASVSLLRFFSRRSSEGR